ncbi:hypothetical protein ZWY2020_039751 [Hordeum vulgare]|nr:hypothetical protein ZWY2020_039751 [Hordeum vulgare]
MNRDTGERIKADFHELVEVEVGPDGMAVGKYLRVKVKLDIMIPLMRGFVLQREQKKGKQAGMEDVEEEETGQKRKKGLLWCRFEYEHMLDFCYTCGVIGHGEKDCLTKPLRGEVPQFGPWLRVEVYHRKTDGGVFGRGQNSRSISGSEGSQERRRTIGWGKGSRGSGSNAASWKKEDTTNTSSDKDTRQEETEVTSPLKIVAERGEDQTASKVSKRLPFKSTPDDQACSGRVDMDVNDALIEEKGERRTEGGQLNERGGVVDTALVQGDLLAGGGEVAVSKSQGGAGKRFKRRERAEGQGNQERNRIRDGEPVVQADEIARRTRSDALEYEEILAPLMRKRVPNRWEPPQEEFIKINLDGAFTPGNLFSGWGIAARDCFGRLLLARAGRQEHVSCAFGAELHALSAAVTTATEMGTAKVVFETDSQLLAEAMDTSCADASPYTAIIEDLKYELKLWFTHWSVITCNPSSNMVAHVLAQIGSTCAADNCVEWDSVVPPDVACHV